MTAADFARAVGATAALLTLLAPARIDVEPSSDDLLHHRTRLAAAQAEQIEIRNAVARREYAPVAMLEDALARRCRQMAKILERLPIELKRRNPELTAADIELVEVEIARLRNIAADADLDWDEAQADDA
jgi:phage terminase Nu1 subunit (DNA packaging protein)